MPLLVVNISPELLSFAFQARAIPRTSRKAGGRPWRAYAIGIWICGRTISSVFAKFISLLPSRVCSYIGPTQTSLPGTIYTVLLLGFEILRFSLSLLSVSLWPIVHTTRDDSHNFKNIECLCSVRRARKHTKALLPHFSPHFL